MTDPAPPPAAPPPRIAAMVLVVVGGLSLLLTAVGAVGVLGAALTHPHMAGPLLLSPWAVFWIALEAAVSWIALRGGMLLLGLGPSAPTAARRLYGDVLLACGAIGLALSGLCTGGFLLGGLSGLGDPSGLGAVICIIALAVGLPTLLIEWLMVRVGRGLRRAPGP